MVLGAGLAGLAAAASLAGQFDRVTIVEGDSLPLVGRPAPRRAPGSAASPAAPRRASRPGRAVARHRRRPPGLRRPHSRCAGHPVLHRRWPSGAERPGLSVCIATRPLIEAVVRHRVLALPNVSIVEQTVADGLLLDADGGRVTGAVRCPRTNSNDSIVMDATLVVDATGRRSHTPGWLAELGYPPPAEERFHVGVHYSTRLFHATQPTSAAANRCRWPYRPVSGTEGSSRRRGRPLADHSRGIPRRTTADRASRSSSSTRLWRLDLHEIVAGAEPVGEAATGAFPPISAIATTGSAGSPVTTSSPATPSAHSTRPTPKV